jgi:hypothetical protein
VKTSISAATTGLAGSVGGMMATPGGSLSVLGIALVTGISCLFGMLSSASRIQIAPGLSATRVVLMNGGAVWIAAFSLSVFTAAGLASAALIGLGVGLAGTKALEVIEAGAVALAQRVSGKQPVTREEMQKMLGDVRNDTQAAVSDINVRQRRRARREGVNDDNRTDD